MIGKGKLLAGRYRLLEQIDSGGTAHIFRAKDEMADRIVAVKILKPELTENEEFVQRFKKEVQASLKLKHANIIRGYDAGLDDGMYYIVMELIDGKTLKSLINEKGPLPVNYVVSIAKKLCLALEYAHVKGFIHRDIKPHNVMLDASGEPYIADFGIAKNIGANTITMEDNSVMGSVHYFSPEQARGERADRRSDIYSLGIVMYEMLTGEVPFDGDTSVTIALKHINEQMPDMKQEVSGLPESLNRIILKASQKDKHFRYKNAFAMYEDLQRCLNEPDGEYIKYTESKRAQQHVDEGHLRRSRRSVNKLWLTVGIAAAVVLFTILLFTVFLGQNSTKMVAVPRVVDLEQSKAIEQLDSAGLVASTVKEYSSKPMDTVLNQNPLAGTEAEAGSVVEIVVSKGLGSDVMPDVVNIPLEQAQEELKLHVELPVEIERSTEGEATVGFVMEQIPAAGADLGDAEVVRLIVKASPDEKKIVVPDVLWGNISTALDSMDEAGFSTYYVYEDESGAGSGVVLEQKPAAGEEYPQDQPVSLYVSEFHDTKYTYKEDLQVDIPEDKTQVVVAIHDIIDRDDVYYVVYENVETQGTKDLMIEKVLGFDSEEESLSKRRTIFLNGHPVESRNVTLEKTE